LQLLELILHGASVSLSCMRSHQQAMNVLPEGIILDDSPGQLRRPIPILQFLGNGSQ
jgi:hypothetical protein